MANNTNTWSAVVPQILAQGLRALRKTAFLPMLVNRQYEAEAAMKGTAITVPSVSSIAAQDVTPDSVPPTTLSGSDSLVTITLDKWKEAPFFLTEKELLEIMEGTTSLKVERAVQALADQINVDIFSTYKSLYGYVGTAGTTPFATDEQEAIDARKKLTDQLAPYGTRFTVLDTAAEAKALKLRLFQDASWRNDSGIGLREGMLGRTLGFDWYTHNAVPTHTKGAAGTVLLDDTVARAVGTTTLHVDGVTTLPVAGDIFTIAGDTQTYVVVSTSILSGTDADITFQPGLVVAIPAADGNEAVTFKATHTVNLALHQDCITFATRPLDSGMSPSMAAQLGVIVQTIIDPLSRVALRLCIKHEHRRLRYALDCLYGVKVVRPELGVRIAG